MYLQNLISGVVANIAQFLSNYSPEATLEIIVVCYNKNKNNNNTRFDRKVLPSLLQRSVAEPDRFIKKLFISVRSCVCVGDLKLNLTDNIILLIYLLFLTMIYFYFPIIRILKCMFIRYFIPILRSSSLN